MNSQPLLPRWEHFEHEADIGIRGIAPTLEQAFEQAAIAMTAAVTNLDLVSPSKVISISCEASDNDMLLASWINELVYEMSTQGVLFNRFEVIIDEDTLSAIAYGEAVDPQKHQPAVEIKGATLTELRVYQQADGTWVAQCVVDV
ncbi:archease [Candidatus Methylobacter oryzae]|uniref:Archease n=1 Tax=Candidatus Methylobacter oryzae TaxID=2497749 RepID=A0ABY3CA83_9GAMM|nr:archease [Candidatus Methylobacter oryzae]TRW93095.1 archease [Candidatus Methylobacter oryzae]